jgi:exosortase J
MDSDPQGAFSEASSTESSNHRLVTSAVTTPSVDDGYSEKHDSSSAGMGIGYFRPAYSGLLISVLVAAGSYTILPIWLFMCHMWLNDPLRAIGAIFPLISFAGTLVAWRRIGWSMNGSLWGLPVLALSILLARITTSLMVALRVHQQNITMLHPSLVLFLYGVGAVLLFGGTRLLRVSIAPLCLLLFVNPVPLVFNTLVDLPLQFLSANTARHFAHLIGLHPTGEQLRMMFSPTFGMMIVPGCNGVRGSVTLGYLALIFGYIRHLRGKTLALTVLGAFLMGYALNLLRLCILVIYYRIGLSVPSIQPYGAGVDYGIGCTLFLFATLGVGLFVRWLEREPPNADAAVGSGRSAPPALPLGYGPLARVVCFLSLTVAFIVPMVGKGNSLRITQPSEQAFLGSFPSQVGPYRLVRTYIERDNSGLIDYALADYAISPNGTGTTSKLTLGLFVGSGVHLVAYSRFAQGLRPDWTGSIDATDASVQPPMKVHFVTTLFDDGIRREYDAESVCYETGCSANIDSGSTRLFFNAPTVPALALASSGNRLSILLRREWPDSDGAPTATGRSQFEADARQFTEQLDIRTLLHEDGTPI